MTSDLQKYRQNLFYISKRMEVINEHLKGISKTKYLATEVEFLCIQFRKVLELIALSSLVANKEEYSRQHDKFAKHWNARLILQDLKRVNPKFYPIPSKISVRLIGETHYFEFLPVTDGFLTIEDFLDVYEKCGGMLHAENPYAQKKDLFKIRSEFPVWFKKIVTLLDHHIMELVDKETMISARMLGKGGLPEVTPFNAIKDPDGNPIPA